ncbi:MAG: bifunctional N-acetylglucosamine-1-phosphate uridyltransferase/glucosamine-1-phosphate acetyltransferase [Ponticaulis sp.]|nr:bifunctional N-acetylglucosamine-1-phosphate uridyltransferase/glucosamine-1-phosphate acetyltransferase [Ponticaulis sp.]|tara:strand:+ start:29631 stop:30983 length:1353 start_codon:yes stop_codon:yes gene_type:complete
MQRAAVILAAGKGTRMQSETTKVLHKVGGRMMVDWSLNLADQLKCQKRILVIGTHSDDLRQVAMDRVGEAGIAVQDPPMGTGHAVQCAESVLRGFEGMVVILYADTPLLPVSAVEAAFEALEQGGDISVLGFDANEPGGYGRLICNDDGELLEIVEAKDASSEQLAVSFCNSGVMAVRSKELFELLGKVTNANAKGEYYLTDIVALGRERGLKAVAVKCSEEDVLGVNSRVQLAEAEQVFQSQKRKALMESGVTMTDPETVYFSFDTEIGRDVSIEPNVVFGPGVSVEEGVEIRAFCHLEGCRISSGSQIGPFARLRRGADLGKGVRVGNFVEVKNTRMDDGAKANHLAYLGDGKVGARSNIGAGTIFCNYDGYFKHATVLGEDVFVGSNSALVAPLTLGDSSFIGSGSVITDDVPEHALALGRGKQHIIDGWASAYHADMKQKKQNQDK